MTFKAEEYFSCSEYTTAITTSCSAWSECEASIFANPQLEALCTSVNRCKAATLYDNPSCECVDNLLRLFYDSGLEHRFSTCDNNRELCSGAQPALPSKADVCQAYSHLNCDLPACRRVETVAPRSLAVESTIFVSGCRNTFAKPECHAQFALCRSNFTLLDDSCDNSLECDGEDVCECSENLANLQTFIQNDLQSFLDCMESQGCTSQRKPDRMSKDIRTQCRELRRSSNTSLCSIACDDSKLEEDPSSEFPIIITAASAAGGFVLLAFIFLLAFHRRGSCGAVPLADTVPDSNEHSDSEGGGVNELTAIQVKIKKDMGI